VPAKAIRRHNASALHLTFLGPLGLFVVAAAGLGAAIAARRNGRAAEARLALGIALVASVGAIFSLTLVPDPGPNTHEFIPLTHILGSDQARDHGGGPMNLVGNLILFLPLGATLGLLGLRRRTAVLTGFTLAACIEIAQLFVPGRTTSADDVLLNTLSTLLGHVLASGSAPVDAE
jgi:hypothetical protein